MTWRENLNTQTALSHHRITAETRDRIHPELAAVSLMEKTYGFFIHTYTNRALSVMHDHLCLQGDDVVEKLSIQRVHRAIAC